MLNISNYELESANNTLIINDIKFEIDKIEIAGKYNIVLKIKNQNIILYLDLKKEIFDSIQEIITKFSLSESSKFGYDYYSCQSDTGLQEYNKVGYTKLREYFNSKKMMNTISYCMYLLYILSTISCDLIIRGNLTCLLGKEILILK